MSGILARLGGRPESYSDAQALLNEHLAAVVQSSQDAIFTTTPVGIVLTWNPGAERLYGYTAQEIIGTSAAVLLPPDDAETPRWLDVIHLSSL